MISVHKLYNRKIIASVTKTTEKTLMLLRAKLSKKR